MRFIQATYFPEVQYLGGNTTDHLPAYLWDLPGLFPVRTMLGILGQVLSVRAALTLAR